jgi:hypothetical protein
MNKMHALGWAVFLTAGCSGLAGRSDADLRAGRHMKTADSLESVSQLREAALEYVIVAELYPSTAYYPEAVRKAALLLSNLMNSAPDDSVALHWARVYLHAAPSIGRQTEAKSYVELMERIVQLRHEITLHQIRTDSLIAVALKQSSELSAQSRRIQELQAELASATEELKKLREVDIQVHKRGAKK